MAEEFRTRDAGLVLDAFLSRLALADLEALAAAQRAAAEASLNGNSTQQFERQHRARLMAEHAVLQLTPYDLAHVLSAIRQCAAKLGNLS